MRDSRFRGIETGNGKEVIMVYEMNVRVHIRPIQGGSSGLELAETQQVELHSLSDAAEVLVKLHEFFEALRRAKAKS